MQNTVTLEHAKAHLEDLMVRAGRDEEWLVVDSAGKPLGTLTARPAKTESPAEENTAHRFLFGLMKGQIKILPGFDDPLEEFKEYMG